MTDEHEELAIDSMSIIRLGTQDLLIDACAYTRELIRIPMLVNSMTFSWRAKNGTLQLTLRSVLPSNPAYPSDDGTDSTGRCSLQ
jgi:hypothetical protein